LDGAARRVRHPRKLVLCCDTMRKRPRVPYTTLCRRTLRYVTRRSVPRHHRQDPSEPTATRIVGHIELAVFSAMLVAVSAPPPPPGRPPGGPPPAVASPLRGGTPRAPLSTGGARPPPTRPPAPPPW